MTDEQAQQLAEAIAAVEYGRFVESLLEWVEAGEITVAEVLARIETCP